MCWDLFTQIVSLHLINFSKNILVLILSFEINFNDPLFLNC